MKTYLLTGLIYLLTLSTFAQTESEILNSENPSPFLEKAEFYYKEARKHDRKIAVSKKMFRYAKKVFEKDLDRYNEYKEGGNEVLIEQFRQKVEKEEQILKKLGEMIPVRVAVAKNINNVGYLIPQNMSKICPVNRILV